MKKFITILIVVLIILIILILYLQSLFGKKEAPSQEKITPIPTLDFDPRGQPKRKVSPEGSKETSNLTITPTISPQVAKDERFQAIPVLPKEEVDKLEKLKNDLPYETEDFAFAYFPLFNKFILSKKTAKAEEEFRKWAEEKGVLKIIEDNNLKIVTDQPTEEYKKELEKKYQERQKTPDKITSPEATDTSPSEIAIESDKNIDLLVEFIKVLLKFEVPPVPSDTVPLPTGGANVNLPISSSSLSEIFNEVGQKVGVPPTILEAVMYIEYPSTFNLLPDEIAQYSTPGNTIPGCGPNACSATGPMQMTIGIDNLGTNSCSGCGLNYCPNAWIDYGRSVNMYGGYSHDPNVCNLKDNVYAAAFKMKSNSGASDPVNWTQDQVYKAAKSYYGECSTPYTRPPIGRGTYCELVWQWYTQKQNNTTSSNAPNGSLQAVLGWSAVVNNNLEYGIAEPRYFNRLVNPPQNAGYTATYREGKDSGVGPSGTYWCTNSVIDSYNLAGINGLGSQHQAVVNMRNFWMNTPNYKYIDYLTGDKALALSQTQPGCAVFFEKNPGVMTGLEHVGIIKSVNVDSSANGYIETYDSNSTVKITRYPIYSADVKNTPLGELLVGFGCL